MNKYLKFLLAVCILSVFGCKDEEATPSKTRTELLTLSPWKMTAATYDPGVDLGGTIVTDIYAQVFEDCDKDDTQKYNTNGTLVYDEGENKCDPSLPQTGTSSWRFNTDETKIIIDSDDELTFDIEAITSSELQISQIYDGDEIGGNPLLKYKLTFTYSH